MAGKRNEITDIKIKALENEIGGLRLRRQGKTYQEIGEELDITTQGAHKAVKRAFARAINLLREEAEEEIQLMLERLDFALTAIWPKIVLGELGAIDRLLKIEKRRADLKGLDAPKAIEINWRKEAEKHGIELSDEFEKMVQKYAHDLEMKEQAKELEELELAERPEGADAGSP